MKVKYFAPQPPKLAPVYQLYWVMNSRNIMWIIMYVALCRDCRKQNLAEETEQT